MAISDEYIREQLILAGAKNFASQEAEEGVLSALLIRCSDMMVNACIGELSASDFYFDDLSKIFGAIKMTVAKRMKIDLVTVDAALTELYPNEAKALSSAMMNCVNGRIQGVYLQNNVEAYIQIVKELSARRRSIRLLSDISTQLMNPSNAVNEVLDNLRCELLGVTTSKHKWESMADVMLATYEYLESRANGTAKSITTGIANIDSLIGGFFGSELTVIGARPSVGKSAFAANIALAASKQGFKVGVASREMSDVQFGQRMIAHEALIDGMKLRKADLEPDDWCMIADCLNVLSAYPINFLFTVRTVEDLRREVQRKVEEHEMDMLIVDYLQLMESSQRFRDEYLRVGHISKMLKGIATDFNIPVVALAQVNRDTDGQMPTLKSLRASGDIEQDADGVIFLHRPSSENDLSVDPRDREFFSLYQQKGFEYISIGVAKQRQGATGTACVLFDPAHMRYFAIDREQNRQQE